MYSIIDNRIQKTKAKDTFGKRKMHSNSQRSFRKAKDNAFEKRNNPFEKID